MKNKIVLIILLATLYSATGKAQETNRKIELANNFAKSVFLSEINAKNIMDSLMYFEPNEKYSMKDRCEILRSRLEYLKKEKSASFNAQNYEAIPYESYKDEKIKFSKSPQDVIILISNGKPLFYLFYKNDKIFAFEYIQKDKDAYFITY